jgi:hypothetical protein
LGDRIGVDLNEVVGGALDSYWIRCTLQGTHDEHKDEHTGLTWKTIAEEKP